MMTPGGLSKARLGRLHDVMAGYLAVDTRRYDLASIPGRFGWDGGVGTSGYSDPKEDIVGILMT